MTNKTNTNNNGYNAMREYNANRLGITDVTLACDELLAKVKQNKLLKNCIARKLARIERIGDMVYVQFKDNVKLSNGGDLHRMLANHLHAHFGGMRTCDLIWHNNKAKRLNPLYKWYWMVEPLFIDQFHTEYQRGKTIQQIRRDYK